MKPHGSGARSPQVPLVSSALGLHVGGADGLEAVTAEHLVDEGVSWGLRRADAASVVADLVAQSPVAVRAAADSVPGASSRLVDLLLQRAIDLRER